MLAVTRAAAQPSPSAAPAWRVTTLEHVDLWYHGIALIGADFSTSLLIQPERSKDEEKDEDLGALTKSRTDVSVHQ